MAACLPAAACASEGAQGKGLPVHMAGGLCINCAKAAEENPRIHYHANVAAKTRDSRITASQCRKKCLQITQCCFTEQERHGPINNIYESQKTSTCTEILANLYLSEFLKHIHILMQHIN